MWRKHVAVWFAGLFFVCSLFAIAVAQKRPLDVPFVPTPPEVVKKMLQMANVGKDDIVYDLGCGDGRIVIAAVRDFNAKRGVGVDLDPQRIRESNENARKAGVTEKVLFIEGDLFKADIREATVVTLYLLPSVNLRLRPKLFRELKPGSRVVSHDFDMGDWEADKVETVDNYHTVYYWVIPAGVAGTWRWAGGPKGEQQFRLELTQVFQKVKGMLFVGKAATEIRETDAKLVGRQLSFTTVRQVGGQQVKVTYNGQVNGDTIEGTVTISGQAGVRKWVAKRDPATVEGTWRWAEGGKQLLLTIERRDGQYFGMLVNQGREQIDDFYVWGAGVQFTIERDGKRTYNGVVRGDKLIGTVNGEAWVAERVKQSARRR
ncbi:MAG: class I SAM-dependent methyltransferase [Armatimonadota bacterium]|nr:class I SAM-dependent methyltransferase [Armatimonadota bacterium]MDW8024533.1 class I SAM-dependent methyltransferase [Armatimonadota bacterium]